MFQADNSRFNSAPALQLIRLTMRKGESLRVPVSSMAPDGTKRFFDQYTGSGAGRALEVVFFGIDGDSAQDRSLLVIDAEDPRLATVVVPATVAFRYRFMKIQFTCQGTDANGSTETLLRGEINFTQ